MKAPASWLRHFGHDISASVVVFLVALPLCLGVAIASDADPVAGIVAGMAGGIVVGLLSGSSLSVSGPAAGLASVVAGAIHDLPSYEVFVLAVFIAGILQIILGIAKAGIVGRYIPNAVIKGMLAAIGILLILKQIPHAIGYDADPEGEEAFFQPDGENTFSEILHSMNMFSPFASVIAIVSLLILVIYEWKPLKQSKISLVLPGPLIVVAFGILMNEFVFAEGHVLALRDEHLVQLPTLGGAGGFFASLPSPDWQGLFVPGVWLAAFTIAIIASLETLLSLEAVDKLDPEKRISPPNRELLAQGAGNMVSGLLGGLPVTSVIVRSSANVNAGAKTKVSTILHGVLLTVAVLAFPGFLNKIPKSALAGILIFTGYKLASFSLIRNYYRKGWHQFLPFMITILAILFTDLLIGVMIGILAGLFFVMKSNFRTALLMVQDENRYLLRFSREVSFLNKSVLIQHLEKIEEGSSVLIDAVKTEFMDPDIIETVNDFIAASPSRQITVYIKRDKNHPNEFFTDPYRNEVD